MSSSARAAVANALYGWLVATIDKCICPHFLNQISSTFEELYFVLELNLVLDCPQGTIPSVQFLLTHFLKVNAADDFPRFPCPACYVVVRDSGVRLRAMRVQPKYLNSKVGSRPWWVLFSLD